MKSIKSWIVILCTNRVFLFRIVQFFFKWEHLFLSSYVIFLFILHDKFFINLSKKNIPSVRYPFDVKLLLFSFIYINLLFIYFFSYGTQNVLCNPVKCCGRVEGRRKRKCRVVIPNIDNVWFFVRVEGRIDEMLWFLQ